jgi:nucleoside-diphosphate-sugar epimerase
MQTILITGSSGQIGSELARKIAKFENTRVICSDLKEPAKNLPGSADFVTLDVTDKDKLNQLFKKFNFSRIYHLAAILSAVGEAKPDLAWDVNMNGLYNMLEMARKYQASIFVPSSIAAFGPDTPKENTPQDTLQRATSMYGITKVAGELLCDYYYSRFEVDTRGVRFPGLISYLTQPGGGTTDYAVEIFFEAVKNQKYTCFLQEDTRLDMMYMPDAIDSMIQLMNADPSGLIHRNAFNIAAYAITPKQLAEEIKQHIPKFKISYKIDPIRQAIADSWPESMDDSAARREWNWKPRYTISDMVFDMLENIKKMSLHG